MDGKIFFGILARRLSKFLIGNGYIDMSIQKAGVPGSPGCIEHTAMIWHTIQITKRGEKTFQCYGLILQMHNELFHMQ